MPYISVIFKGLAGRCLFMSNTVTASQRWRGENLSGYQYFGISLLGIGPGDIVAGGVIVRFTGAEQSWFRLEDGNATILPPPFCFLSGGMQIISTKSMMLQARPVDSSKYGLVSSSVSSFGLYNSKWLLTVRCRVTRQ